MDFSNSSSLFSNIVSGSKVPAFLSGEGQKVSLQGESRIGPAASRQLKSWEDFLGENKLLKTRRFAGGFKPSQRDYYISQAILREVFNRGKRNRSISEDDLQTLQMLMLHLYNKAAPNFRTNANPFSAYTTSRYHRLGESNKLLADLEYRIQLESGLEELAEDSGVFSSCHRAYLFEDGPDFLFREVVKRKYGAAYQILGAGFSGPGLSEEVKNCELLDISALFGRVQDLGVLIEGLSPLFPNVPDFIVFTMFRGEPVLLFLPGDVTRPARACGSGLQQLRSGSGFVPTAEHIARALIKFRKPSDLYRLCSAAKAELATAGQSIPNIYNSYEEFLTAEAKVFQGLIDHTHGHKKILAQAIVELLNGLGASCQAAHQKDLGVIFAQRGLSDLIQCTYFRINLAARQARFCQDDLKKFVGQLDIINQEIQMLLTLVPLYDDRHLERTLVKGLKQHVLMSSSLNLQAFAMPSAMHCLASIISSAQNQKGGAIRVAIQQDSYYESVNLLSEQAMVSTCILPVDGFDHNRCAVAEPLPGDIDVYLCEFHHNISIRRSLYRLEDVLSQLAELFAHGKVSSRFTLVIDTTLDLDFSREIKRLLNDSRVMNWVDQGNLNIVLFRSSQKFDMLGFDNYYGGVVQTINNGSSFNSFMERISHQGDALKGANYQGLCHLFTYAAGFIDSYKKAIMSNASWLYELLPQASVVDAKGAIRISRVEDDKATYLDLKCAPYLPRLESVVFVEFKKFCSQNHLPISSRASFGFANSNIVKIRSDNPMNRLSLGIEDPKDIQAYAYFFHELQAVVDYALSQSSEIGKIAELCKGLDQVISGIETYVDYWQNSCDLSGEYKDIVNTLEKCLKDRALLPSLSLDDIFQAPGNVVQMICWAFSELGPVIIATPPHASLGLGKRNHPSVFLNEAVNIKNQIAEAQNDLRLFIINTIKWHAFKVVADNRPDPIVHLEKNNLEFVEWINKQVIKSAQNPASVVFQKSSEGTTTVQILLGRDQNSFDYYMLRQMIKEFYEELSAIEALKEAILNPDDLEDKSALSLTIGDSTVLLDREHKVGKKLIRFIASCILDLENEEFLLSAEARLREEIQKNRIQFSNQLLNKEIDPPCEEMAQRALDAMERNLQDGVRGLFSSAFVTTLLREMWQERLNAICAEKD